MDEPARLNSFLEDIRPACLAIQAEMTPLRKALGHLYQLGDDDNPKAKLQSFGAMCRDAIGPAAAKSLEVDLEESEFNPKHAHVCRLILRDAVADEWNSLGDLLSYEPEYFQVLSHLHNMAWSALQVRERHLLLKQVPTIEKSLQKHRLSAYVASEYNGRLNAPPYLSQLLDMVKQKEEAAAIQAESCTLPPASGLTGQLEQQDRYVTLGMMSGLVNRQKRTLERWIRDDQEAPLPDIPGGGGKPNEWYWPRIKPWLEKKADRELPDNFPTLR